MIPALVSSGLDRHATDHRRGAQLLWMGAGGGADGSEQVREGRPAVARAADRLDPSGPLGGHPGATDEAGCVSPGAELPVERMRHETTLHRDHGQAGRAGVWGWVGMRPRPAWRWEAHTLAMRRRGLFESGATRTCSSCGRRRAARTSRPRLFRMLRQRASAAARCGRGASLMRWRWSTATSRWGFACAHRNGRAAPKWLKPGGSAARLPEAPTTPCRDHSTSSAVHSASSAIHPLQRIASPTNTQTSTPQTAPT